MITKLLNRYRAFWLKRYIRDLEKRLDDMKKDAWASPEVRFHVVYVEVRASIEATLAEFKANLKKLEAQ